MQIIFICCLLAINVRPSEVGEKAVMTLEEYLKKASVIYPKAFEHISNGIEKMKLGKASVSEPKFNSKIVPETNLNLPSSIQMLGKYENSEKSREMIRLAGPEGLNIDLQKGQFSPGSTWLTLISKPEFRKDEMKRTYAELYHLTKPELDAINTWTDKHIFLVSSNLPTALSKISPYEGIGNYSFNKSYQKHSVRSSFLRTTAHCLERKNSDTHDSVRKKF